MIAYDLNPHEKIISDMLKLSSQEDEYKVEL